MKGGRGEEKKKEREGRVNACEGKLSKGGEEREKGKRGKKI